MTQRPPRKGFDKRATDILKDWMLSDEHIEFPYPNEQERQMLADETGMSVRQVLNWFVNARKRIWQPLLLNLGYDAKRIVTERKHMTFRFDDTSRSLKLQTPNLMDKTQTTTTTKRKGHWSKEEEKYAEKLIQGFVDGMLPLKKGTALRTFLASRLNCHPMRISKKFAKQAKLGKAYFIPRREPGALYLNELQQLEQAFNHRIAKENLVTTKTIALQQKLSPVHAKPECWLGSDMELMDWTLEWDNWFTPNLIAHGYP